LQALASILGGTQSLHCNGRDEALALPTEDAARIALRTQQVIAAESGVANTVDPVAGSWVIESRTDEIEAEARALIARIDAAGGTIASIEAGHIQRQVQDAAYAAQLRIDRGESIVVGVNRFATDETSPIPMMQVDPDGETRQAASVAGVRQRRDARACSAALEALATAATGATNLVPAVLTAVEAHATLGEISDTLRRVFGEHRELHV
jgi:methylmalonyl-CoA mutase N-terminal domain/subunit